MTKGLTQKAKQGGWPGRAPVGYLNHRERTGGRETADVRLDPERAILMREAFKMYATGDYSLAELQAWLGGNGLTNPFSKKVGAVPHISSIAQMLANPFYAGIVEWNGVRYPGTHKPLISMNVFEQVQEVLRVHNKAGTRKRKHDHYLKGLVACGECGRNLSLTLAKSKYLYLYCRAPRGAESPSGMRDPPMVAAAIV